jgi:hypothetical protein
MYYGDLKEAIDHYTRKFGAPKVIFCNPEEYKDTNLIRVTEMRFPEENFALAKETPHGEVSWGALP